jgi:hypothetical protein
METVKIAQVIKRAHELRKAAALLSYANWLEIHGSAADTQSVMATARRVLRKADRA